MCSVAQSLGAVHQDRDGEPPLGFIRDAQCVERLVVPEVVDRVGHGRGRRVGHHVIRSCQLPARGGGVVGLQDLAVVGGAGGAVESNRVDAVVGEYLTLGVEQVGDEVRLVDRVGVVGVDHIGAGGVRRGGRAVVAALDHGDGGRGLGDQHRLFVGLVRVNGDDERGCPVERPASDGADSERRVHVGDVAGERGLCCASNILLADKLIYHFNS